jgi:Leucine-rich repeat (LRR) protein
MGGKLKSITLRSESKGLEASLWMPYLNIMHVERLDASFNHFDNLQFKDYLPPSRLADMDQLTHLYLRECKLAGIYESKRKNLSLIH